ncbi:MAG: hypothetical protein II687_09795 [Selenomonadaceae bacterium]|jgi:hypothetical protein|nr:hypothetical protein [Selenomonadaceae bacterium]
MNNENLIPASRRSKKEARENGRKGGQASGRTRRRKKAMRTVFRQIATMPVNDAKLKRQLEAAGMDEETTYAAALAWKAIYHAMKGNSQMMRLVMEMLGEDPSIMLKEREIKLKEKQGGNDAGEPTIILLPQKED